MATTNLYSDEEFDELEEYDAHLGKCKKHINNVAVANKAKAPIKAKVIQLPKEKKKHVTKVKTTIQPVPKIQSNPIAEPVKVVDDWEELA